MIKRRSWRLSEKSVNLFFPMLLEIYKFNSFLLDPILSRISIYLVTVRLISMILVKSHWISTTVLIYLEDTSFEWEFHLVIKWIFTLMLKLNISSIRTLHQRNSLLLGYKTKYLSKKFLIKFSNYLKTEYFMSSKKISKFIQVLV